MDFAAKYEDGLSYDAFLEKYANPGQQQMWSAMHNQIELTGAQKTLLGGFKRQMKVLCMSGAWCGDCVEQCPILDHFEKACPQLEVRYFDRDDNPDLMEALQICGGARVPQVVFLSEDGFFTGHYGDRTLAKYRVMIQNGPMCPTGLFAPPADERAAVIQEWLNEFERIQLILLMSGRLREKHGD